MVLGFGRPMQLLRGGVDRFRRLTEYVRGGFSAYRQRNYECGCCEVIVLRICSTTHNFYVVNVHRNLDLSDNFFYCLLKPMFKVQSTDRNVSFLFIGDVDAHQEE